MSNLSDLTPVEQYKWIIIAITALAVFGCGCAAGLGIRGNIAKAAEAELKRQHSEAMQEISNHAVAAAKDALAIQRMLSDKIAAIDAARTEENERAKTAIDALSDSVRAGHRRLSVAAKRQSGSGGLSEAANGSSVGDDAARVELDPAAADRIIRIAAYGDTAIRQLSACQAYIKIVTQP